MRIYKKRKDTMNQQKLKNYSVTGSIHTLAIKSPGIIDGIEEKVSGCIIANSQTQKGTTTTSIINVNKLYGDIFSFSEFETAFNTILAGAGIDDYSIVRADMRFDSYEKEHYRQYAKLNRYLISALAVTYKVNNSYKSTNLFTQKQLSIAIKNKYFECENYDKEAESNGTDIAKSRLEQRSKSFQRNDLKSEFVDAWSKRWDKAIKNLTLVHKTYNNALERLYKEDKNAYPTRFRSLTDFLIQYQDCIFCKAQLIDLLSRFEEVKDPKIRAENHKKRYGIEYFSKKDVMAAVKEIKRATIEFFES